MNYRSGSGIGEEKENVFPIRMEVERLPSSNTMDPARFYPVRFRDIALGRLHTGKRFADL